MKFSQKLMAKRLKLFSSQNVSVLSTWQCWLIAMDSTLSLTFVLVFISTFKEESQIINLVNLEADLISIALR